MKMFYVKWTCLFLIILAEDYSTGIEIGVNDENNIDEIALRNLDSVGTLETCTEDIDCPGENRKCSDAGTCVCKIGYEGEDCTTVTGCKKLEEKCLEIGKKCIYDKKPPERATCDCGENFKYDRDSNKCLYKCSTNGDCQNGGTCYKKSKQCNCMEGTFGNKCDIIADCLQGGKYQICSGDKGKCEFDTQAKKAVCSCEGEKKLFEKLGYCEAECVGDKDCLGNNRKCNDDGFCMCKIGYEGDDCKTVTGCKKFKEKCQEIGKKCIYDKQPPERATCVCDEGDTYDRDSNKCLSECTKDEECPGDNKKCKDGKFCICIDGFEGEDCRTITGCKVLQEKCNKIAKTCIYDAGVPGKATCDCGDDAYDVESNKCLPKCTKDDDCLGDNKICKDGKFCTCKDGYEGEDCEIVTGCKVLKEKCDKINKPCMYDESAPEKATCDCGKDSIHDKDSNRCLPKCTKDDECPGGNIICKDGKFCTCKDGYEGGYCKTVTGCKVLQEKCDKIRKACIYDQGSPGKATCDCGNDGIYDRDSNRCLRINVLTTRRTSEWIPTTLLTTLSSIQTNSPESSTTPTREIEMLEGAKIAVMFLSAVVVILTIFSLCMVYKYRINPKDVESHNEKNSQKIVVSREPIVVSSQTININAV